MNKLCRSEVGLNETSAKRPLGESVYIYQPAVQVSFAAALPVPDTDTECLLTAVEVSHS